MSCLGCCRSYTSIPHINRPPPVSLPQKSPSESKNIVTSNGGNSSSEVKKIDSSPIFGIESLVKKRRTRRSRPPDLYTKAVTDFYNLYPRIFSDQDDGCPLVKLEPRSPAEQELPALISRLQQADNEARLLLSNLQHVASLSPSSSPSASPSKPDCNFDEKPGEPDESCGVESLLESSEMIDGGMDSILGDAESFSGEHNHPLCVFGDGERLDMSMRIRYLSAIRRSKDIGVGADSALWTVPAASRLRPLKEKLKAEKEMNAMSFCSLDEAQHGKLSLKLDYQEVVAAWSDRGSLYTDAQCPQTVPDDDDNDEHDDSSSVNENASMDFGLVPDLRFWRFGEENFIPSNYNVEDAGSSTINEGTEAKTGGIREARVLRYKEKRQTRLFSKKIRYEVRKLNAEKRPRMKGRFVRTGSD